MRSPFILASILVVAAACRGGGGDDGDDTGMPDGPPPGADTRIQDIQDPNGTVAIDQVVNVRGVVVTAIDNYGPRKGNFFVQEPEGGEYSGVLVYNAPLEQVAMLAVGDLIDIEGAVKQEFALTEDESGRTTTELGPPPTGGDITIREVGTMAVPTPAAVDAIAISMLSDLPLGASPRDAEWEKWEGVPITVTDVTIMTPVEEISGDPDFVEFTVTGDLHIDSSLAALPDPSAIVVGECADTITGIGDYFFSWKVLPRQTTDVGLGGTDCEPIKNVTATVAEVQTGTVSVGSIVTLEDVYVVSLSRPVNMNGDRFHLWVADSLTAAPNEGVYVYRGNSAPALGPEIEPGAVVTITGATVAEYNGDGSGTGSLTQVTYPASITVVSPPGALPTPLNATAMISTLADATNGEPYEGSMIELDNVEVTQQAMGSFYVGRMQIGSTTFGFDDDILRTTDPVGTCYLKVVGIWSYLSFAADEMFAILPISVTPGGTCN